MNTLKLVISLEKKALLFTQNRANTKFIEYGHDAGHAYSYIEHKIVNESEGNDDCEDMLNTWLYENDELPPCKLYFNLQGDAGSSCGCHDGMHATELQDVVQDLLEFEKTETYDMNLIAVAKEYDHNGGV
jgi:hypothetical protein